ncbi:MAG TPA: O-antigen ligase family protein [Candidatus Sulfomarinibacteraceae bacterium]|nr:O-antigen ligase family protein [Candidatus Sulfomarinibacteraceae bacterium]
MLLRHRASRSAVGKRLAESVLLGAAVAALLWSTSQGKAGPWPLLLAVPPFFVAWIWGGVRLRRTPLALPLLIFAATALVGVWAAYDRQQAVDKWWLLVGALLLFYALAMQEKRTLWTAGKALAVIGTAVAATFLLTHDWQAYPVKFSAVNRLAQWWVGVRPALGSGSLHPNVAGSLMAMLLPFQLVWAAHSFKEKRAALFAAIICGLALTSLTLLLTASRGAALAGIAGGGAALVWLAIISKETKFRRLLPLLWSALLLLPLLLTLTVASGEGAIGAALLDRLPGPAQASHRALLAADTHRLVADFSFTGGGLAAFPGLYSQYILRIPHYMLPNGHNLLLDVALEQGILGIGAFLVIAAATLYLLLCEAKSGEQTARPLGQKDTLLRLATIASFVTLIFHGLVEDTVYGSSALPLLFVAPAFAIALAAPATRRGPADPRLPLLARVAIGGFVMLLALFLVLGASARATLHANLGAVEMARIQLDDWPTGTWATGSKAPLMGVAESQFQRALLLNPRQPTARYRLGALAMLRRDYIEAVSHLEIAYEQDPEHSGVRKALGFSHLWAGNTARGTALLSDVEGSRQELRIYSNWWRRQGRADLAQQAGQALEQLEEQN